MGQILKTINKKELEFTLPSYDTNNYSEEGDLYLYGPLPFRYISVATNGKLIVNMLKMFISE